MNQVQIRQFSKRTKTIEFKRQLWPQPPEDAKPWWWGLNTLAFYRGYEKVWEQDIPESKLIKKPDHFGLDRIFGHGHRVEFDENFGWLLVFESSHEEADRVWGFILKEDS